MIAKKFKNNKKSENIIKFVPIFLIVIIGLTFILSCPDNLDIAMTNNFKCLMLSYWGYAFIWIYLLLFKKIDLLEPIVFFTVLYVFLFAITPLFDIITENTLYYLGFRVFDSCIKSTVIAFFSYIMFLVAYYSKIFFKIKNNRSYTLTSQIKKKIYTFSLIIWCIGFLFSILFFIMSGRNIIYIFFMGATGNVNPDLLGESMLYGSFNAIGNLMYASWMYIFIVGKNKFVKIITFYCTLSGFVIRGFRINIIILVVAPIVYYYISRRKRPSLKKLILFLIPMLILIGIMPAIRGSLRKGDGLVTENIDIVSSIGTALEINFGIYKAYYAVVDTFPNKMSYTLGQDIFGYTLTMLIPRLIWREKPQPVIKIILENSLTPQAAKNGDAYPLLGEYYAEFGILGCLFFMYLLGLFCKKLKQYYTCRTVSIHKLVAYSLMLPALMQIIIRGYTPSNFWMVISILTPVIILRFIFGDLITGFQLSTGKDNISIGGKV